MEMLLSRDEKKQYQLEQINDLVENNGGLVRASDIDALGVDYRRVLKFAGIPIKRNDCQSLAEKKVS